MRTENLQPEREKSCSRLKKTILLRILRKIFIWPLV